jgi:hypothetical protein
VGLKQSQSHRRSNGKHIKKNPIRVKRNSEAGNRTPYTRLNHTSQPAKAGVRRVRRPSHGFWAGLFAVHGFNFVPLVVSSLGRWGA